MHKCKIKMNPLLYFYNEKVIKSVNHYLLMHYTHATALHCDAAHDFSPGCVTKCVCVVRFYKRLSFFIKVAGPVFWQLMSRILI